MKPEIGYDANRKTYTRDGKPITDAEAMAVWLDIGSADYSVGAFRRLSEASLKTSAADLGRKGGKVKSEAKAQAVRQNGKRGGRPVKVFRHDTITADQLGRAFLAASRAGRSFSDLEREVLMHRATTSEAAAAANEILAAMLDACR